MITGMQLFHADASPFARKVRVVLHETGQPDRVALIPVSGGPLDPGTMPVAENPLGKLPTLARPDGPSLYDSRVICRFLAEGGGGAGAHLYPAPPRLWETLTLEATADGIMDAAVLMVYEHRLRPAEHVRPEIIEAQWAKAARSLDVIEARWISHLAGAVDIGQIALACALGYLDLRHGDRAWRTGRPRLAEWAARFATRPSMAATAPPAP